MKYLTPPGWTRKQVEWFVTQMRIDRVPDEEIEEKIPTLAVRQYADVLAAWKIYRGER